MHFESSPWKRGRIISCCVELQYNFACSPPSMRDTPGLEVVTALNKVSSSSFSRDTSHWPIRSDYPHTSVRQCPHGSVYLELSLNECWTLASPPPCIHSASPNEKKNTPVPTVGLVSADKWIIKLFPFVRPCLQMARKTFAPLCFWANGGARPPNKHGPFLKWLFQQPFFFIPQNTSTALKWGIH